MTKIIIKINILMSNKINIPRTNRFAGRWTNRNGREWTRMDENGREWTRMSEDTPNRLANGRPREVVCSTVAVSNIIAFFKRSLRLRAAKMPFARLNAAIYPGHSPGTEKNYFSQVIIAVGESEARNSANTGASQRKLFSNE